MSGKNDTWPAELREAIESIDQFRQRLNGLALFGGQENSRQMAIQAEALKKALEKHKTRLTLDEVIDRLDACTGVYLDGEELLFPNLHDLDDDEMDFLELESTYGKLLFGRERNKEVSISASGSIILHATNGSEYDLFLLKVVHAAHGI